MEKIMANVWGKQTEVNLGTWGEIKALGFKKRDRFFGALNDGRDALYFGQRTDDGRRYEWFLTVEKLEDIEEIYEGRESSRKACDRCDGTGRLKAEITICWTPDYLDR
jgi:hypothetical protein